MTPNVYLEKIRGATRTIELEWLRKSLGSQIANGELSENIQEILDEEINKRWIEIAPRARSIGDNAAAKVAAIQDVTRNEPAFRSDVHASRKSIFPKRRHIASPDRERSRLQRRRLGLSRAMPDKMAEAYTEAPRSVGAVIAEQHMVYGCCTLAVDAIAAKSGTCPSTVRNYRVDAVKRGEITVIERPVRGGPNDTNVIRITDPAWLRWLKKRAKMPRGIGCKGFNPPQPTKERYTKPESFAPVDKSSDDPRISSDPPRRPSLSGAPS
jgi:hypothetical protein